MVKVHYGRTTTIGYSFFLNNSMLAARMGTLPFYAAIKTAHPITPYHLNFFRYGYVLFHLVPFLKVQ